MTSTGDALRLARQAARPRISLARMAELTRYSKSYLGNVETGTKPANPDLIAAYESALRLPDGVLLEDTVQRRALLAGLSASYATTWLTDHRTMPTLATGSAALAPVLAWGSDTTEIEPVNAGGPRVDEAAIDRLRQLRGHFQEMYRRAGGAPTRPRITAALISHAAPLLAASYDNTIGRRLVRAVGGLTALAGVCAYDADMQATAQQHMVAALRMAKASGDLSFGCYVVALIANQAMHLGDYRTVVQCATEALHTARSSMPAAMAADLHGLAAKALARMRDDAECRRHLHLTETAAERIGADTGLAEASYMTPGLVETQLSEALRRLGDSAAYEYALEAVRTADATHIRGQVHRHAGLALALAERGDIDEAAAAAHRMLDCATGMESGRIRDRIGTVVETLARHDTPIVVDLVDRAQTATMLGA